MSSHSCFLCFSFLFILLFCSCDNIFLLVYILESMPKVKPRIPSASLSQSVAVDETVLPASSQNITAYALNTEPSEGYRQALRHTSVRSKTLHHSHHYRKPVWFVLLYLISSMQLGEVTGVTAVGETPQRKQNYNTSQCRGSKLKAQTTASQCIVSDTLSQSLNAVENTNLQRNKPESTLTGE